MGVEGSSLGKFEIFSRLCFDGLRKITKKTGNIQVFRRARAIIVAVEKQ
jgi:hypothetical protein